MNSYNWHLVFLVCVLLGSGTAQAGHTTTHKSNVKATKHNLSASGTGSVKANAITGEKQICVFCHTPHGAESTLKNAVAPLWNRKFPDTLYAGYTAYASDSLDAVLDSSGIYGTLGKLDQPGLGSKLCLSCHDGTVAIGKVNVANGRGAQTIALEGVPTSGVMPAGSGETTGFTARLGGDLSNDHPISVYYNAELVSRDGELRTVNASQQVVSGSTTIVAPRFDGSKPLLPLALNAPSASIQCATCHDPHVVETDATLLSTYGNQKFLRLNRFQANAQPAATFNKTNDIICLGCHEKGLSGTGGASWAYSVHANENVKNGAVAYTYTDAAATLRDFPLGLPVWKVACLNCHDTHTVQGARRLLREGTNEGVVSPKSGGSNVAAQEETCYQCHAYSRGNISAVTAGGATVVPQDIYKDFTKTIRMPITTTAQGGGTASTEVHNIGTGTTTLPNFNPVNDSTTGNTLGSDCAATTANTANKCGADFMEPRTKLGANSQLGNRHVECTDCHNPHRMVRFQTAFPPSLATDPIIKKGTHQHTDDTSTSHTNIISGVLRGTFGVEPEYNNGTSFFTPPSGYVVKRGDPGTDTNTAVSALYVTREYQICLKCHSDYAYDDNNRPDVLSNRPALGGTALGLTPPGANGLTKYSSVAREMQAPSSHKGEPGGILPDSGAYQGNVPNPLAPTPSPTFPTYTVDFKTNNHRSWKPVLDSTGRTTALRGNMDATMWNLPWSNDVGNQTMYCSDCHGSATPNNTAIPDTGENWGSHGSQYYFLLKGPLDRCTGTNDTKFANCLTAAQAANENPQTPLRSNPLGDLCFKCHSYNDYAGGRAGKTSGFSNATKANLHDDHYSNAGNAMRCTWCHIAVTHGWKNKAFLVNLNDVGPEVRCRAEDIQDGVLCRENEDMLPGTQVRNGPLPQPGGSPDTGYWIDEGYTNPPYYLNALLKIVTFATSGNWQLSNIGSVGLPGTGETGESGGCGGWMSGGDENCSSPP